MKLTLCCPLLALLIAGCSGGASEPTAAESATSKDNFSRSLTDAEKAKAGAAAPVAPPDKKAGG